MSTRLRCPIYSDVLNDFRLLWTYANEKNVLTPEQNQQLSSLSKREKEAEEQRLLAENKQQKQYRTDALINEIEDKIHASGMGNQLQSHFLKLLENLRHFGLSASAETRKIEKTVQVLKKQTRQSTDAYGRFHSALISRC